MANWPSFQRSDTSHRCLNCTMHVLSALTTFGRSANRSSRALHTSPFLAHAQHTKCLSQLGVVLVLQLPLNLHNMESTSTLKSAPPPAFSRCAVHFLVVSGPFTACSLLEYLHRRSGSHEVQHASFFWLGDQGPAFCILNDGLLIRCI